MKPSFFVCADALVIQKLVRRWKEISGRLKRQKEISKCVCLKMRR